ncbi:hypothetical protein CR956_00130 [Candidatus Saccharibacteria bacterium]|nr:MAG: hypothetical protein CR956_00130 [Candidatus Saccharibacteria bacterium]
MRTLQLEDLKFTARTICKEMMSRGIKVEVISTKPSLVRYEIDGKGHFLHSTISEYSPALASEIANNKMLSSRVFEFYGWNHPETKLYEDDISLNKFIEDNHKIVVKPLDGAHGNGVSVGIGNMEEAKVAIKKAKTFSDNVLLQRMVSGEDYRLMCVDGKFIAAIKRIPASVVGDGESTILELIESENKNPKRGSNNYEKSMLKISVDGASDYIGAENMANIPQLGEKIRLSGPANIGLGGTAVDVTDIIPDDMIKVAESVSSELNIVACGVDFMWDGSNEPYLIEINSNPGIGNHDSDDPAVKSRGVAKAIVDYLVAKA